MTYRPHPADIEEALAFADEYAPEHLSCVVADEDAAGEALRRVEHAIVTVG